MQNTPVSESQIFRATYYNCYASLKYVPKVKKEDILCYHGLDVDPRWIDIDAGRSNDNPQP